MLTCCTAVMHELTILETTQLTQHKQSNVEIPLRPLKDVVWEYTACMHVVMVQQLRPNAQEL